MNTFNKTFDNPVQIARKLLPSQEGPKCISWKGTWYRNSRQVWTWVVQCTYEDKMGPLVYSEQSSTNWYLVWRTQKMLVDKKKFRSRHKKDYLTISNNFINVVLHSKMYIKMGAIISQFIQTKDRIMEIKEP